MMAITFTIILTAIITITPTVNITIITSHVTFYLGRKPHFQCTKLPNQSLTNFSTWTKKLGTLLDLCVSSLRRGHANLLCIVPILSDDPRRKSNRGLQNRVMGLEGTQKNTFSNELEHELFIVKGSQSCRVLKYVNIKTSCPDDLIVLKPL